MIDFHCHLDLYPDPIHVVREAVENGVYVLSVTTTPKAWRMTSALTKDAVRIRTALGLHPQIAHERQGELPLFEALLPGTAYVGEIGLDGAAEFRQHSEVQRRVFRAILKSCAAAGGKVMSIHTRHAATDVLNELRIKSDAGLPILHWFSGTKAELIQAIDQGCWFSIGPAMLRSAKGRALASAIPVDRILTETDGPFGLIQGSPMVPTDAALAVKALAEIWGIPLGEARRQLADNLRRLGSSTPGPRALQVRS